jgi:ubiquinone/menaquinone biosynthesis C-methylase UbiE
MPTTLWDLYAAWYDALRVLLPYMALQQHVIVAAALSPTDRLLNAGCATGNLEWLITRELPELAIVAVDFSPKMLAHARAKNRHRTNISYRQADLCTQIPCADASMDVAVMCNVLYALADGPAALAEVHRILRPGGRLVLCDRLPESDHRAVARAHLAAVRALPVAARLWQWLKTLPALPALACASYINVKIQEEYLHGNYHFYTAAEIGALLERQGFSLLATHSVYAEQNWLVVAERTSVSSI